MPQIECPACSARMNAPDTAIGKRIKCPKCAEAFVVEEPEADEGFEVIEEPVRAKPKSRAVVVVDDDDEEDDDEDERPKKKARKGKKKPAASQPIGLWIGAGVVALLLIGGGVFFATRGSSGGNVKDIRWVPFTAPDKSFATAFPDGEPVKETMESLSKGKPGTLPPGAEFGAWSRTIGERKYVVGYFVPPGGEAFKRMMTAEMFADKIADPRELGKDGPFGGKMTSMTKVSVNGIAAAQLVGSDMGKTNISWIFYLNGRIYMIGVEGELSMTADDPKATAFMNKFAKGG